MVRYKSRHLLCEIVLANALDRKNITNAMVLHNLKDAILRIHGDYGLAVCIVSLSVKYLNAYTGIVLIRCRKDAYLFLCSALPFITCLDSRTQQYPCFFNTLHVAGTIRTCQKFLIQYNQKQLLLLLRNCTSEEERNSIQRSILGESLQELDNEPQSEEEDTDTD